MVIDYKKKTGKKGGSFRKERKSRVLTKNKPDQSPARRGFGPPGKFSYLRNNRTEKVIAPSPWSLWMGFVHLVFAGVALWMALGLMREGWALSSSPIKKKVIEGLVQLERTEILQATAWPEGLPLSEVNTFESTVRLTTLPRVAYANIRRVFPSEIWISLKERTAVARMEGKNGSVVEIDAHGVVLGPPRMPPGKLPLIRHVFSLPAAGSRIVGEPLNQTLSLLAQLALLNYQGAGITLELSTPHTFVLTLPKERKKLLIPSGAPLKALTTYLANAPVLTEVGKGFSTVDLRMADKNGGFRILFHNR